MPGELVGPDAQRSVGAIAAALPPFHQAGFECRLDADGQVDLQQAFPSDEALRTLLRFLAAESGRDERWDAVARLAERHLEDGLAAGGLAEIWVEPDVIGALDQPELQLADLRPVCVRGA